MKVKHLVIYQVKQIQTKWSHYKNLMKIHKQHKHMKLLKLYKGDFMHLLKNRNNTNLNSIKQNQYNLFQITQIPQLKKLKNLAETLFMTKILMKLKIYLNYNLMSSKIRQFMLGNGSMVKNKVRENNIGVMDLFMKV